MNVKRVLMDSTDFVQLTFVPDLREAPQGRSGESAGGASPRRRRRWPCASVIIGLTLSVFSAAAHAASYVITNVADNTGPFNSFGVAPAVNANGTVAFLADTDSGGFGIYAVHDGSITTIAERGQAFLSFEDPAINDSGAVAFWALVEGGASGVFVGSGGPTTTIADTTGPWSTFGSRTPAINAGGTVAFWAGLDVVRTGIYATDGGPITIIAEDVGTFWVLGNPAINAGGTVAFWALHDGGTKTGIYTGAGGPIQTIADTLGPWSNFGDASINDAGTVAFRADWDVGGSGIFTASGLTIATIVDSSGPFMDFRDPRISGNGSVIFGGFLDNGLSGIYTGPDPAADKVIQTGDSLFGSTVTGYTAINFFGNVNDSGALTFWYGLANGVTGIALASPVAPPLEADFDEDRDVDGDDLAIWEVGYASGTLHTEGDADGDGDVDGSDFLVWQRQYGSHSELVSLNTSVPEPTSVLLFLLALVGLATERRRSAFKK